jgi:prepilin peptidase CpaA
MRFYQFESWPLWTVCAVLFVAAWGNERSLMLRNKLTFPLILSGWTLGLVHSLDLHPDGGSGGIGGSLANTFLAMLLLLPAHSWVGLGAGAVKLQMGFGAWSGAFLGLKRGAITVVVATLAAAIIFSVVCLVRYRRSETWSPNQPTGLSQWLGAFITLLWTADL